jgi:DNA-binding NtrC family response regulator/tetratricopeptide (TPR) repeat protein
MAVTLSALEQLFRLGRLQEILIGMSGASELRSVSAEQRALYADVLQRTGRPEQAMNLAQDVLNNPVALPTRARCEMVAGLVIRDNGDLDEAVRLLRQSQRSANDGGHYSQAGWSALFAFRINSERCAPNVVSSMLSDVRRLVTRAGDPHLSAFLHETVARQETQSGRLAEARRHLNVAAELLVAFPNAWLEQYCALNAFCLEFYSRNPAKAQERLEDAARLAETTGALDAAIANNRGHLLMQLGQRERAEEVLKGVAASGRGEPLQSAIEGLARLYLVAGRFEDCEQHLNRLEDLLRRARTATSFPYRASLITRIRLALGRGHWSEAERAADIAIRESNEVSDRAAANVALFLRGLALSRQDKPLESARAICEATEAGVWSIREYQPVLAEGVREHLEPRIAATTSIVVPSVEIRSLLNSLASAFDLAYNPMQFGTELGHVIAIAGGSGVTSVSSVTPRLGSESRSSSSVSFSGDGESACLKYAVPDSPRQALVLSDILRMAKAAIDLERYRQEERNRAALWPADPIEDLNGSIFVADEMRALLAAGQRVASTNVPLLITGETGTGKEVLARAIHAVSNRAKAAFLPFNCTSTPKDMVDSQLFGHRRGAFTGATDHFPGIIRAAAGGTLFLDEIGDMSLEVQPKLLRFLESGEVHPIGETQPKTVDVRVIAATNVPLDALVTAGRFREDLFYRLNIVHLHIPPLRERRVEIPTIAHHYLQKHAREFRKGDLRLSEDTMEYLVLYRWPGNVRQLANEMRRMAALAEAGAVLMPEHLSPEIAASRRTIPASQRVLELTEVVVRLDQPLPAAIQHLERAMLQYALKKTGGRMEETASILGVSRKGLYLKRQRFGIEPPRDGHSEVA